MRGYMSNAVPAPAPSYVGTPWTPPSYTAPRPPANSGLIAPGMPRGGGLGSFAPVGLAAGPRPVMPLASAAARTAMLGLRIPLSFVPGINILLWGYTLYELLPLISGALQGGFTWGSQWGTYCRIGGGTFRHGAGLLNCGTQAYLSAAQEAIPYRRASGTLNGKSGWWYDVHEAIRTGAQGVNNGVVVYQSIVRARMYQFVPSGLDVGVPPQFPPVYNPLPTPAAHPVPAPHATPSPANVPDPWSTPQPNVPPWLDPLTGTPSYVPWGQPANIPPPRWQDIPRIKPNPWRAPSERPVRFNPPKPAPRPRPNPRPNTRQPNFQIDTRTGRVSPAPNHQYRPPRARERERKMKGRGVIVAMPPGKLKKGLSGLTEALEVVNILYDCLPSSYKKAAVAAARKDGHQVGGKKKDLVDNPLPDWWPGRKDKVNQSADSYDRSGYNKGNQQPTALPMMYKGNAVWDYLGDELSSGKSWSDLANNAKTSSKDHTSYYDCVRSKLGENFVEDLVLGKIGQQAAKASRKLGLPTGVQTGPSL